ncbi:thioesterase II family protein [Streptomyces sp. URMC 123]|uniref:thioesterase II family protein n=1 Tax=Streptomyces sp. URMC 123 TaxID=3423403 RepID=UPI003F1CC172
MTHRGWIRRHAATPRAPRLTCFPHAGGGASFYQAWATALAPGTEVLVVQYPGREDRFHEPLVSDMATLADAVVAELPLSADDPLVLFGHSMGSAVAYEVALRIERACPGALARLCVSGRPAPHAAAPSAVHLLPDDELVEQLRGLAGTSDAILDSRDFRALFLPAIRNDYRLIETYRPAPPADGAGLLSAPVTVLYGADDPHLRDGGAQSWREVTRGAVECRSFTGGHFYLVEHRAEVVAEVARHLRASGAPARR